MRASASIPIAARPVRLLGRELLDGGVADSIPVKWFEKQGFKKQIVVLTRPEGYVKKPMKFMPLIKLWLHGYPALVEGIRTRHLRYNGTLEYIKKLEASGSIFVIRPQHTMKTAIVERNPNRLREIYEAGRRDMSESLEALQKFLIGENDGKENKQK